MSDYFWLTKEQLQRLRPFFRIHAASRGPMIGGYLV